MKIIHEGKEYKVAETSAKWILSSDSDKLKVNLEYSKKDYPTIQSLKAEIED